LFADRIHRFLSEQDARQSLWASIILAKCGLAPDFPSLSIAYAQHRAQQTRRGPVTLPKSEHAPNSSPILHLANEELFAELPF
jgi:hypothetical protein